MALPDVPQAVLAKYPGILAGIQGLEEQGFPVLVKDASLGGQFPVMCVTLMNPRTGGVFASFGAHPSFEVALERSLTELLQGRSFEGLNDVARPTFESQAVTEPNNSVDHFIDSSGVVSWRFFNARSDYDFVEWDFTNGGSNSNAEEAHMLFGILQNMGKDAYMAVYEHLGANFRCMFGNERMDAVIGSVAGKVRFHGLAPTNMQLDGLDKHLRMIDSLKKTARSTGPGCSRFLTSSPRIVLF